MTCPYSSGKKVIYCTADDVTIVPNVWEAENLCKKNYADCPIYRKKLEKDKSVQPPSQV